MIMKLLFIRDPRAAEFPSSDGLKTPDLVPAQHFKMRINYFSFKLINSNAQSGGALLINISNI